MARKRHSDEYCLEILRQVEMDLAGEADVAKACRSMESAMRPTTLGARRSAAWQDLGYRS
jgi:hypothetical protein